MTYSEPSKSGLSSDIYKVFKQAGWKMIVLGSVGLANVEMGAVIYASWGTPETRQMGDVAAKTLDAAGVRSTTVPVSVMGVTLFDVQIVLTPDPAA